MPVLSEADREAVAAAWMQQCSALGEELSFAKSEVYAATAAMDDWRVANQASGNAALPPEFRAEATTAQKSRLTTLIFHKAYEEGA